MNDVETEDAVSALVERPFDPDEFPEAFGTTETTLRRLPSGPGEVTSSPAALKHSPATREVERHA